MKTKVFQKLLLNNALINTTYAVNILKQSAERYEQSSYIYKRYQILPNSITKGLMGCTKSSDGSLIKYLTVLKTKRHRSWLQVSGTSNLKCLIICSINL